MLRFLRSYNTMVIVIILLIGVMTWLHVWDETTTFGSVKYDAFMFRGLNGWLAYLPAGAHVWLGLFFTLLTAVMLVYANARLQLIDKISYLPAFCYVTLIGGVPEIHLINPVLIATVLLIAAFIILSGAFESERLSYNFFTASAMISFATLFCTYMYAYMLMVWVAILFWRPGYWREWVFSVLGFALPFFFAFSWFFLVENDLTRMGDFFYEMFSIQQVAPSVSISSVFFFAAGIAVCAAAFVHLLQYVNSKKAIIRTRYYILMMMVIITVGMTFVAPDVIPYIWYMLAFPMSFIISGYLNNIKSLRWGAIILAVLLGGVAVAQAVFLRL